MSTTQSERLRGLLEPLVAKTGLDLEEITVTAAGSRRQLMVVVDSDDGVQLDAVAQLSRDIAQVLDDTDAMGQGEYVLEVSSPGTDRPLTTPRHFRRNEGRLVKLTLNNHEELTARIMALDEAGLDLEVPGIKGRKPKPRRVEFAEIAKARVEIEFNRKNKDDDVDAADTADADTDSDESIEEA
ncbi:MULTISPECIES: ribosome maturation factor RimP [unclassified Streptomyces]|uniref:ribosome maturation factor RimP n=1 Tax=unclassified Streptomyces TaxID=2593676 RepID=UPI00203456F4|nr:MULTISPECIES: ribosome maturation factor RimP [unclassified Streptomyces]MCM2421980.1 ribosome maturation factor RimP [Streptomyces sp. RKAG293]MCM2425820.1 ribosome maturation factor RimP [Streptomyces sp. RKAG337]